MGAIVGGVLVVLCCVGGAVFTVLAAALVWVGRRAVPDDCGGAFLAGLLVLAFGLFAGGCTLAAVDEFRKVLVLLWP